MLRQVSRVAPSNKGRKYERRTILTINAVEREQPIYLEVALVLGNSLLVDFRIDSDGF